MSVLVSWVAMSCQYDRLLQTADLVIWFGVLCVLVTCRYRMPVNGVHGFSKPFSKSVQLNKGLAPHPPLFEKTVLRIRDGFQKLPLRGTFTRASKGLTAEWYPMDYQDLEAIRRRGFFHETIGDIQKYSYRDFSTMTMETGAAAAGDLNQSSTVLERSGSQLLSATKANRRGSMGQHVSRQYASTEKLVEEDHRFREPEDTYSGFMKWDTRAAAVAITDTMKKRRSSVSNHMARSTSSGGSVRDGGSPFSPHSFNYPGRLAGGDDEEAVQLSLRTDWDDDQGQGQGQNAEVYQSTSNFLPFSAERAATTDTAAVKPSYISSLFGKLGMEQPEAPGVRASAEVSEPDHEREHDGAGYTSDPGYSTKHNGSSRFNELSPAEAPAAAPTAAASGTAKSPPLEAGTVLAAPDANAELGAQSGEEQKQIDAYLKWLEAQEAEGAQSGGGDRPLAPQSSISAEAVQARVVEAVKAGYVPNELHLQRGLEDIKEEKWETKLRLEREKELRERGEQT